VQELKRCWQDALARPENRTLVIELDEVAFVDDEGRSLLREMNRAGATLVGRGAQCRHLVEEIQQRRTG
jgi:hypothetical protein